VRVLPMLGAQIGEAMQSGEPMCGGDNKTRHCTD
jgi:hypothetical protein